MLDEFHMIWVNTTPIEADPVHPESVRYITKLILPQNDSWPKNGFPPMELWLILRCARQPIPAPRTLIHGCIALYSFLDVHPRPSHQETVA